MEKKATTLFCVLGLEFGVRGRLAMGVTRGTLWVIRCYWHPDDLSKQLSLAMLRSPVLEAGKGYLEKTAVHRMEPHIRESLF